MILAGFSFLKPGYFICKINNLFHEIKVTNVNEISKNKVKLEVILWLTIN